MTTNERFCLFSDLLKWYFTAFQMNVISVKKCIADADVVTDVTSTCQKLITQVSIRVLSHDIIHWITAMSYDKRDS